MIQEFACLHMVVGKLIDIGKFTCFQLINQRMVMDLVAYQNESAHAQTFQPRLAVQSSEAVAMLLSLLELYMFIIVKKANYHVGCYCYEVFITQ